MVLIIIAVQTEQSITKLFMANIIPGLVLTALLLPIFLATLERSQDIAIAILARGFDYNIAARTYRRQLSFTKIDYIFQASIILLLIGGLVLNYYGVGNPTEQLVMKILGYQ